ncbi:hypothetical protein GH733_015733 [Mirounga leonina]|nr:hypothetical protein GH733_015733 [Mirounga leonina]
MQPRIAPIVLACSWGTVEDAEGRLILGQGWWFFPGNGLVKALHLGSLSVGSWQASRVARAGPQSQPGGPASALPLSWSADAEPGGPGSVLALPATHLGKSPFTCPWPPVYHLVSWMTLAFPEEKRVVHGLQAYDGLSLPEDAETVTAGRAGWRYSDLSDDEDLLADEASGDGLGSGDLGSGDFQMVYFRALVNFTRSIHYSPQLEDAGSEEFREVSEAVVDTVR